MAVYKVTDPDIQTIEARFQQAGLEIELSRLSPDSRGLKARFSGNAVLGKLDDIRSEKFDFSQGKEIYGLGMTAEAAIRDLAAEFASACDAGQAVVTQEWRQEVVISNVVGQAAGAGSGSAAAIDKKPARLGWGVGNAGTLKNFTPF